MSSIYLHYIVDKDGNEIPIYVGKSNNVVQRIIEHLANSLVDSHTVLYKFVNDLPGNWESVKMRILHSDLPSDSSDPVVCYYERLYYDSFSQEHTLYNSCPPLLSATPVNQADIKKYKKYQVKKDALINNILNGYLAGLVKMNKFTNISELSIKYKNAVKDKGVAVKTLKDVSEQLTEALSDKKNYRNENLELKKNLEKANEKIDKYLERADMLSDKLISELTVKRESLEEPRRSKRFRRV